MWLSEQSNFAPKLLSDLCHVLALRCRGADLPLPSLGASGLLPPSPLNFVAYLIKEVSYQAKFASR